MAKSVGFIQLVTLNPERDIDTMRRVCKSWSIKGLPSNNSWIFPGFREDMLNNVNQTPQTIMGLGFLKFKSTHTQVKGSKKSQDI